MTGLDECPAGGRHVFGWQEDIAGCQFWACDECGAPPPPNEEETEEW